MTAESLDYSTMCFVVMPFGKKPVGQVALKEDGSMEWKGRVVDFDKIYEEIFVPAIAAAELPEGGNLVPFRTDMNSAAANIDVLMFRGLEYARMVLSDITGLNPNVFYELGVRHHSRPTGTAIFRQADGPIPFDINHIKAFPYEYDPPGGTGEMITRVLTETLKLNPVSSPVQVAVQDQQVQPPAVQDALMAAEEKVRAQDPEAAIVEYQKALDLAPNSPLIRFKLGLMHKYKARWDEARAQFRECVKLSPDFAEAYRELGIAENRSVKKAAPGEPPPGEASLRKAVELAPHDWDALSSLGGILKRDGRFEEALEKYESAAKISEGHPYPLLNTLKLRVKLGRGLRLDPPAKFQLARAERLRKIQVENPSPLDAPWSYFDLSEIRLYFDSDAEFLKYLDDGILHRDTHAWQAQTHREGLQLLVDGGYKTAIVSQGIGKLGQAEKYLP